jgi:acyl-CoA oxidase
LRTPSFEGDNYVLDHQVVRAASKAYARFKSNLSIELSPSSRYLRALNVAAQVRIDWANPASVIHLLELRAAHIVSTYAGEEADAGAAHRLSMAVADAFVVAKVEEMIELTKVWGESRTRVLLEKVLLLVHLYLPNVSWTFLTTCSSIY